MNLKWFGQSWTWLFEVIKIRALTKNKAHLLMKMFFIWDDKSIGFKFSLSKSSFRLDPSVSRYKKSFRKYEREIANRNYLPAILTALLRRSNQNEERCSIPDAFISSACAPGNHWLLISFPVPTPMKNFEVVKNGAGSLQQFEMEKDYYIQKQKDEIALLRSQVSDI